MKSLLAVCFCLVAVNVLGAETHTWDGKHPTGQIEVTCVYFVPSDRTALVDWQDRIDYFRHRLEQFHAREFGDQSTLTTMLHKEPLISRRSTAELRAGDANAIYHRTLSETDERLTFAQQKRSAFPILLVFSDINWRPLDDFYRLHPEGGELKFEGNLRQLEHFPGATSGGARAAYLANRGVGWGLVSADGWRVPYRGSDCVVYHEGCGHTVGLPHPEPGNHSAMSLGQYHGWLSESWLNKDQKLTLGWEPGDEETSSTQLNLFSQFRALPEPVCPQPGEAVKLKLRWPVEVAVKSLRVRFQTSLEGPWIEVPQSWEGAAPQVASLPTFDRPTPVSYRVDAQLDAGETAELWGYFQVRNEAQENPQPLALSTDLQPRTASDETSIITQWPTNEIDLLALADPETCWMHGKWVREEHRLLSPKMFGARLELPYTPPEEYRLTLIVEPLDAPNGLILGQRSGSQRFVSLFSYRPGEEGLSAIENVDGRNVGNDTTFSGSNFQQNRPAQVVVTVRREQVTMSVDGRKIVDWKGKSDRLSLSDYWKTPADTALFLGAYDCRYRFHRVTLEPLKGEGKVLTKAAAEQANE